MYLLLDECCGRSLLAVADRLGHTAQRTFDIAALGRQASDQDIFEFARRSGAVFVTVNRGDFIRLAARGRDHPGVILIPSLPMRHLKPLFEAVLAASEPLMAKNRNLFVEIGPGGNILRFRLP